MTRIMTLKPSAAMRSLPPTLGSRVAAGSQWWLYMFCKWGTQQGSSGLCCGDWNNLEKMPPLGRPITYDPLLLTCSFSDQMLVQHLQGHWAPHGSQQQSRLTTTQLSTVQICSQEPERRETSERQGSRGAGSAWRLGRLLGPDAQTIAPLSHLVDCISVFCFNVLTRWRTRKMFWCFFCFSKCLV